MPSISADLVSKRPHHRDGVELVLDSTHWQHLQWCPDLERWIAAAQVRGGTSSELALVAFPARLHLGHELNESWLLADWIQERITGKERVAGEAFFDRHPEPLEGPNYYTKLAHRAPLDALVGFEGRIIPPGNSCGGAAPSSGDRNADSQGAALPSGE
jgi:hypothetical protein